MSISDLTPSNVIEGATDGTEIGNVGDRLKVDASISNVDAFPAFNSTYVIESSKTNTSLTSSGNGTQIYQYTGSGYLESFWAETDDEDFNFIVIVDGTTIMDVDMEVFQDASLREDHAVMAQMPLSYTRDEDIMFFKPSLPIRYNTSIEIRMRDNSSTDLLGYVVSLTKE